MNIFTQAKIQQVRANVARRVATARATHRSVGGGRKFTNEVARDLISHLLNRAAVRENIPRRYF